MKIKNSNPILLGIIILSFTIISSVEATENLEVSRIEKSKMVRMELNTPAEAAINVRLLNANDRILYSDQISAGATFEDEFDFSTVRNGTYRIVSELGNKRYNRVFTVTDNAVEFKESFYSFVPQFELKDETLLVHYIKNFDGNVGISIEDETGRIFDAYYEEDAFEFANAYGLEGLQPGAYVFHLQSGKEHFSYTFIIE